MDGEHMHGVKVVRYNKLASAAIAAPLKRTEDNNFMDEVRLLYIGASPDHVKKWLGIDMEGPLRKYFESVGANDQCERSGEKFESGKTICWLCGCVLTNGDEKACEHIVPALRAALFSGLIVTQEVMSKLLVYGGVNLDLFKTVTRNNYLWACDKCNGSGVKGSIVCFTLSADNNNFVPDIDKCLLLANKVWTLQKDKIAQCTKNNLQRINRHNLRTTEVRGGSKSAKSKSAFGRNRKNVEDSKFNKIMDSLVNDEQDYIRNNGTLEQLDKYNKSDLEEKKLCAWFIAEYRFLTTAYNAEFQFFVNEYEKKLGKDKDNKIIVKCAHEAYLTYIFSIFRLSER